jgi:hypothetical protein
MHAHHQRDRVIAGRYGAQLSWSRTADRTARTANARRHAPGSIEYHLERLDPQIFASATDEQRLAAAEAARKAYFVRLAMKSAQSRRRGGATT